MMSAELSTFLVYRTYNFYALGLSLGAILDITNPVDYIKALSQIMTEFERHTSDDSKQKMVSILQLGIFGNSGKTNGRAIIPQQKNIFRKAKSKDETNFADSTGDYGYLILPHIVSGRQQTHNAL